MREIELLEKMLPTLHGCRNLAVPPGDDCAAVRCGGAFLQLLAADQLISDVHFHSGATTPERAGAKLLKRNLSDIAAMGGVPEYAVCCVASDWDDDSLLRFFAGLEQCARRYEVVLAGGDMASLMARCSGLVASLTITGKAPESEIVRRSGAQASDLLYVTGFLGNSLDSGHHLDFEPRLQEGRFLAAGHFASAMLDLSDGLLLDAGRLAAASQVQLRLDINNLPLRKGASISGALGDGEDYELLFTVPAELAAGLEAAWPENFAPLRRIGAAHAGSAAVLDSAGAAIETTSRGYIHGE